MNVRRTLLLGLCLLAWCRYAAAGTLETPISVEVYVKADGKSATVLRGRMISYDGSTLVVHVANEDRTLHWADLTPGSAYTARQKALDRNSGASWLDLGKFAWSINLKDQAKTAFKQAVRLDKNNQDEVDAAQATPAGALLNAGTGGNLIRSGPGGTPTPPPAASAAAAANAPVKYQAATPDEAAAAMADYREQAKGIAKDLGLTFAEFETDHFLVFTDWDSRETKFLKENLENAYRVVSKQFNMSTKDNIFIGKLPVYMLNTYGEFAEFAQKVDTFEVTNRTAGYYFGNNRGIGHMAMWKPDNTLTGTNNLNDAKRLWAYVLTHEFTHAFLARYKSNEFVPRWLNEGIAEVIASGEFPYPDHARIATLMARQAKDLIFLFDSKNRPTGEYYPVMQSMVEMLIRDNKSNFLKYVDAIKDGEDPEEALKRLYNTDYENFAQTWRNWARR